MKKKEEEEGEKEKAEIQLSPKRLTHDLFLRRAVSR